MQVKKLTISAYTENVVGLLNQITLVFTRRHLNIDSLNVSETERKGISRFTIALTTTEAMANKVVQQLNKIIEVIHAEYHEDSNLIYNQIALYKVSISDAKKVQSLDSIVRQNGATILSQTEEYTVIQNIGHRRILEAFLTILQDYGETEFVRSGRVALTTDGIRLNELLPAEEEAHLS